MDTSMDTSGSDAMVIGEMNRLAADGFYCVLTRRRDQTVGSQTIECWDCDIPTIKLKVIPQHRNAKSAMEAIIGCEKELRRCLADKAYHHHNPG